MTRPARRSSCTPDHRRLGRSALQRVSMNAPRKTAAPQIRVWDIFVRVIHWTLMLSFFCAYLSTESIDWVHKGSGYLARDSSSRACCGVSPAASTRALPTSCRRRARSGATWAHCCVSGRSLTLDHNPAGAVMIVFLLCAVTAIGTTGWGS